MLVISGVMIGNPDTAYIGQMHFVQKYLEMEFTIILYSYHKNCE